MFPCIPLSVIFLAFGSTPSVARSHIQFNDPQPSLAPRANNVNVNPNGSTFLWLPEDTYSGQNFFDRFSFFNYSDPTHGQVNFVDAQTAFSKSLAYVQSDGTVIIKGDDTSTLPLGAFRDSVRIQSQTQYNTGLFILDLNRAPWGCGTWPAFWTIGGGQWPYGGEIDIIEGVHDNEHNQVAWHTGPGCMLTPNANFTGTIVQSNNTNNLNCDGLVNGNSGCGITDWSRASYGPYFDAQGGGVFAMKWDEIDISVWSFYRAAIPPDITQGSPNPANWGVPSAVLQSNNCDLLSFFKNHSIVFDITFCGDWAGNSYATSGCPGTCADHLMDPNNFVNASWSINSLKVYRKQLINGQISNAVTDRAAWDPRALLLLVLTIPFMIYMH
ncbi:glycoside hydrolase family 16 protein [Tricholoma matsutake]|nr:glycoside hydrolase family 16 protein [Tricholoma matsutake 945]